MVSISCKPSRSRSNIGKTFGGGTRSYGWVHRILLDAVRTSVMAQHGRLVVSVILDARQCANTGAVVRTETEMPPKRLFETPVQFSADGN